MPKVNQEDTQSRQRIPRIKKLQIQMKVLICLIVCIFAYFVTDGNPNKSTYLQELSLSEEKLQQIFETTIAIEKKTFTKRLYYESSGVWTLVPYFRQPKWIDIKVQLKTRIGVNLQRSDISISYDEQSKNVHMDFGEPYVLDRSWQSQIIDQSNNFLMKWSLEEYQEKQKVFIKDLIENESNEILLGFKNGVKKYQLQQKYESKVMNLLKNIQTEPLDAFIYKYNRYVLEKLGLNSTNSLNRYVKIEREMSKPTNQSRIIPKTQQEYKKDKMNSNIERKQIEQKNEQPHKKPIQQQAIKDNKQQNQLQSRIRSKIDL